MLTDKKKTFVKALLAGASQKQAAIMAGYSERSAHQQGYLLAKDPEIQVALQKKWLKGINDEPENANSEKLPPENTDINQTFEDPLDFLKAVMNSTYTDLETRKDAAKALMPYIHTKKGEGGKKEQKGAAAKEAAKKFATIAPPRLVANNGNK